MNIEIKCDNVKCNNKTFADFFNFQYRTKRKHINGCHFFVSQRCGANKTIKLLNIYPRKNRSSFVSLFKLWLLNKYLLESMHLFFVLLLYGLMSFRHKLNGIGTIKLNASMPRCLTGRRFWYRLEIIRTSFEVLTTILPKH